MNHFTHLDDMTILAIVVVVAVIIILVLRSNGQRVVVPTARLKMRGDGAYAYDVGGADTYQLAMERIGGRSSSEHECTAELIPDTPKPGTVAAIQVMVEGATVGFIVPEEAALVHEVLRGRPARCEAIIMGGRGHQKVMLDLKWPPALA